MIKTSIAKSREKREQEKTEAELKLEEGIETDIEFAKDKEQTQSDLRFPDTREFTPEELEDIEKGNIKWTPQGLIKAEAIKKPPKQPMKTNKAPAAAGQEAESLSKNHTSELIEPTKASAAAGHIIPDAVIRLIEYRLDEIEATIKRCENEYTELSNYLKGV